MPAIQVFSGGIKFLKARLFRNFQECIPQLQDGDIHWVLTVPAIWDEAAKKFMRKSAEEVNKLFTVLNHKVQDFVDKQFGVTVTVSHVMVATVRQFNAIACHFLLVS
jgi:hypothetical protein